MKLNQGDKPMEFVKNKTNKDHTLDGYKLVNNKLVKDNKSSVKGYLKPADDIKDMKQYGKNLYSKLQKGGSVPSFVTNPKNKVEEGMRKSWAKQNPKAYNDFLLKQGVTVTGEKQALQNKDYQEAISNPNSPYYNKPELAEKSIRTGQGIESVESPIDYAVMGLTAPTRGIAKTLVQESLKPKKRLAKLATEVVDAIDPTSLGGMMNKKKVNAPILRDKYDDYYDVFNNPDFKFKTPEQEAQFMKDLETLPQEKLNQFLNVNADKYFIMNHELEDALKHMNKLKKEMSKTKNEETKKIFQESLNSLYDEILEINQNTQKKFFNRTPDTREVDRYVEEHLNNPTVKQKFLNYGGTEDDYQKVLHNTFTPLQQSTISSNRYAGLASPGEYSSMALNAGKDTGVHEKLGHQATIVSGIKSKSEFLPKLVDDLKNAVNEQHHETYAELKRMAYMMGWKPEDKITMEQLQRGLNLPEMKRGYNIGSKVKDMNLLLDVVNKAPLLALPAVGLSQMRTEQKKRGGKLSVFPEPPIRAKLQEAQRTGVLQLKDGDKVEKDMIEGVQSILKRIKDKKNRNEIADYVLKDFKKDVVNVDPSKFKKTVGLYKKGGNIDKNSMSCNKPKRTPDHKTKSHVVKACKDGKEKIIRFGQQGVEGAGKNPKTAKDKARKKSYYARHNAQDANPDKFSARYWSNKTKW